MNAFFCQICVIFFLNKRCVDESVQNANPVLDSLRTRFSLALLEFPKLTLTLLQLHVPTLQLHTPAGGEANVLHLTV